MHIAFVLRNVLLENNLKELEVEWSNVIIMIKEPESTRFNNVQNMVDEENVMVKKSWCL